MADRSLRGMRLGSTSLQSEEGVSFSPRQRKTYRTTDGTTFEVVFSADAEVPEVWESPKSGLEGRL
ncbi:RNA polymerase-binding protein RbpA, partial [Clavibacter phaseoli]